MKSKLIFLLFWLVMTGVSTQAQPPAQSTQKTSNSALYFSIGSLQGGSYSGTMEGIPFRLYYPAHAEILVLGLSGQLSQSGWLHGFFNLGALLRDIYVDIGSGSQHFTDQLNVATMYLDVGLSIYPLKWMQPDSRFQPFLLASVGTNIVADDWGVILLLGLSGDSSNTSSNSWLADRIDFDLMLSYGGGMDYYFTKNTGIRLSVRKLRLNLPDDDAFFNPTEFNLGVIGRF
ncbi:MAG: hypothetical protein ACE5HS_14575 [bacterium]